ncbi:hypothetical protein [Telluria beijingensis]|uniref:hypothetical protein n=1 Tax=Telluria beijingensis TaxID=3068633 RepID=UPI002795D471|nr:hypothetical protein [Massilia sp. REN29]
MKFSVLAVVAATLAGPALAADPAFCTSMCDSELRECRASAQARPLEERFAAATVEQRNPLARTVQGAVPGQATRALDASGDTGRRMARLDACDSAQQRCTRSCAAPSAAQDQAPPRQPPAA